MEITKFVHSCLLVELAEPDRRTVLFDPGHFSKDALNVSSLEALDDIIITHEHPDHLDIELLKQLVEKFPEVRLKTPASLVSKLEAEGFKPTTDAVEGIEFFVSPHEGHEPFLTPPEQIGVHLLGRLSHPGDSHSFTETSPILALPITAPWGSADRAVQLALQLKPQHIIPIHDWHWRDEARVQIYGRLEGIFAQSGIIFHKMIDGEPIIIED